MRAEPIPKRRPGRPRKVQPAASAVDSPAGLRGDSDTLTPSESMRIRLQSLINNPTTPAGAVVKAADLLIKLNSADSQTVQRPATMELMDFLAQFKPAQQ